MHNKTIEKSNFSEVMAGAYKDKINEILEGIEKICLFQIGETKHGWTGFIIDTGITKVELDISEAGGLHDVLYGILKDMMENKEVEEFLDDWDGNKIKFKISTNTETKDPEDEYWSEQKKIDIEIETFDEKVTISSLISVSDLDWKKMIDLYERSIPSLIQDVYEEEVTQADTEEFYNTYQEHVRELRDILSTLV